MKYYAKSTDCLHCGTQIDHLVIKYSVDYFGFALCADCQGWYKTKSVESTEETLKLYFSLKERGITANLEKFDGYKTVDIAVTGSKVIIEIDGSHHMYNSRRALSGLKRTFHEFLKGYLMLRIPNSLVKNNLEETADYITSFLNARKKNVYNAS